MQFRKKKIKTNSLGNTIRSKLQNNVKVKSRKLEAKLRKTIKTNCQEIDY